MLKTINIGSGDKNFDLLRHRLSDNINTVQQQGKVNSVAAKDLKVKMTKPKQTINSSFNQQSTIQNIYFRKNVPMSREFLLTLIAKLPTVANADYWAEPPEHFGWE